MKSFLRSAFDAGVLAFGVAAVWEAAHLLSRGRALPSPLVTLDAIRQLCERSDFVSNVEATLYALSLALMISMALGLAAGILLGFQRPLGRVLEPILTSLYSLPKVTLYPLVLLIFGLGTSARVAFGAMHGFIPVVLITMNAVRQIRPVYLRAARVMRLAPGDLVFRIILPAALPEMISALRMGFCLSLLGVIIGEMFASKQGVGFMVMNAIGFYDLPTILAIIVLLGAFATSVNAVFLWLGRRLRHGESA